MRKIAQIFVCFLESPNFNLRRLLHFGSILKIGPNHYSEHLLYLRGNAQDSDLAHFLRMEKHKQYINGNDLKLAWMEKAVVIGVTVCCSTCIHTIACVVIISFTPFTFISTVHSTFSDLRIYVKKRKILSIQALFPLARCTTALHRLNIDLASLYTL